MRDAKSDRNDVLDIARGLGMVLVFYGHILQIFFHKRADGEFSQMAFLQWQAIYGFHMPLFFLISGALVDQFAGKSWKDVISRSVYLIVLAYITDAIGVAFAAATQGFSSGEIPSLEAYLIDHILRAEDFITITPWFLVAFALVRLVAYALMRCAGFRRWSLVAALSIVFAASYRWPQLFHLRAAAPGVAFFMMGRYLATSRINISAGAAVGLLAAALWLAHFNGACTVPWQDSCENAELPGHFAVLMIFGLLGSLPLFTATAAMGALGVIGLSSFVGRTWISRPIRLIGKNSLDFLLINGFCLVFANPYLRDRVEINDTAPFYVVVALLATAAHLAVFVVVRPALLHIKTIAQSVGDLVIEAGWLALQRVVGAPRAAG